MWPSVRRCSTTRCPSSPVWTYTRTRSPRSSEPLDPSHTRTGFASRCAGPAMAEGVDAGAACSSRVKSETITRAAFPTAETNPGLAGRVKAGPASLHHEHRARPVRRGPVAELATAVVAPTVHRAPGRDAAGVIAPGAHRGEAHAARHEHRARPVGRGPVAELAVVVVAPAVRRAPGRDAADVSVPGAHCGEAHAARHEHGRQPVGRGPVAELAAAVGAPAVRRAPGRDAAGVSETGAHRGE